jgi:hypothetical protein
VNCQGNIITIKRHAYNYLTSNNGKLRNLAENVSEFWSLVPGEFNAKPDEFVDTSENIAIDQVNDCLQ